MRVDCLRQETTVGAPASSQVIPLTTSHLLLSILSLNAAIVSSQKYASSSGKPTHSPRAYATPRFRAEEAAGTFWY